MYDESIEDVRRVEEVCMCGDGDAIESTK